MNKMQTIVLTAGLLFSLIVSAEDKPTQQSTEQNRAATARFGDSASPERTAAAPQRQCHSLCSKPC
jgi:hypothetical protein